MGAGVNVALTFNPPRAGYECDTPETIGRLSTALRALGHDVRAIEVARPLDELVVTLRRLAPELVFNLAEGDRGRFREAFYPALYEHLGLRHTGSSASVLAVCLDKALAKRIVAAAGVAVPAGVVMRGAIPFPDVGFPAIVKPNFEGSSLGITAASVVTTRAALERVVGETLARYPDGVLVEDFIAGEDVAVGWVAGVGFLPVRYIHAGLVFDEAHKRAHRIEVVDDRAVCTAAERAFTALGVTGYGRADFRVTPGGEVVFLEMNPLPSLAFEHNELYAAAARLGKTPDQLVAAIVATVE
jgi:D-alanine-D-alanine ligase